MKFSSKEELFLACKIKYLLQKGVIKESQNEEGEFISRIFLMPKSGDSFRIILNLKRLNENMPYIHFKMETIKSTLTLVTPNCYMAKVDVKDAYYSEPFLPEHQKYLKFYFRGKLHQFTRLPNGLYSGQRKFTKLLKTPFSHRTLQQVTVGGFIDNLITLGRIFVECERNINLIGPFLDSLGFVVYPDKSVFVPARSI